MSSARRFGPFRCWVFGGGTLSAPLVNYYEYGTFLTLNRAHTALFGAFVPAYARSQEFYDATRFWQWMRFPGDVVFALGALLMAWDFIVKLRPLFPRFVDQMIAGKVVTEVRPPQS